MKDNRIIVARITLDGHCPLMVPLEQLSAYIDEAISSSDECDVGRWGVTFVMMKPGEYSCLPEHEGW